MSFPFIIVALIIRYIRNNLKTDGTMPDLDRLLRIGMYVAIGLFVLSIPDKSNIFWAIFFDVLEFTMLGGLLYLIAKDERFKTVKFLVIAIVPYLVVSIVSEAIRFISKSFYSNQKDLIGAINTFAVLWGLGVVLVTRKQQKELTKARKRTQEEEENNKVISAVKSQLEVQVAERTAELTKQKEELEQTLNELKSAQTQLIQSEKMASLGELTAGIAHEIQNPLNFVNNFSDINSELIDEMVTEAQNGNIDEAKLIADDIKQNNQKIAFHGKRADAIVKSMLQHSRKNTGQKEPSDVNALCDEYIRLSYHGLRAKDKSFNAEFKTDFDETIGKINIVPQDIGRVLLNLFNNAFYAVNKPSDSLKGENYKPQVSVTTKKYNSPSGAGGIQIIVKDNGDGIPQNIVDKIFQPFFTTKPTGSGTGLGLSLSYDIIKAHGGEITINTTEGAGSEFIIQLPA
jgi:two-component system, NtrC family, sensor kinase